MTSQLVHQRIRNRVIDSLEFLVEFDSMSSKLDLNYLVNSWEDWVPSPLPQNYFCLPVFTAAEAGLLRNASAAMDAFCEATPRSIEDHAAAVTLPQWAALITSASAALSAMNARGRMSEVEEEQCF